MGNASHAEARTHLVRVGKYYYATGQRACPERSRRVAMREGGTLYYLFTDHLGSTALTLRGSTRVGELRYHPYGGTRYSWGSTPTGYRFTGQREEATIGLYLQRPLLRPGAGALHQRGYGGAQSGGSTGPEPVCVCAERPSQLYRS